MVKNKLCVWRLFFLGLFIFFSFNAGAEPPSSLVSQQSVDQKINDLPLDMEIIVDFSGSMNEKLNEEVKIDAARKALSQSLEDIASTTAVSLRLYGQNFSVQEKEKSCKDSQLVIPFGPVNKIAFSTEVNKYKPLGMTPIAYSLELAGQDLKSREYYRHIIILISDGIETCGGDPVAVAQKLREQGIDVTIYTVGFAVDDQARKQLQSIAQVTGGKYYDAQDGTVLARRLKEIHTELVPKRKAEEKSGELKFRGGDSYDKAEPITREMLGKEISFVNHIKKGEPAYFYIDFKVGEAIQITAYTGTVEVQIDDNYVARFKEEWPHPNMEIHVEDADQKLYTGSIHAFGVSDSDTRIIPHRPYKSGKDKYRYFLIVGKQHDVHKDSRMKIEILDQTDSINGTDVPGGTEASFLNAPSLELEKDYIGWLASVGDDHSDYYRLKMDAGQVYVVNVTVIKPVGDKVYIEKLFYSSGKDEYIQDYKNKVALRPLASEEVMIAITSINAHQDGVQYKISVKKGE